MRTHLFLDDKRASRKGANAVIGKQYLDRCIQACLEANRREQHDFLFPREPRVAPIQHVKLSVRFFGR